MINRILTIRTFQMHMVFYRKQYGDIETAMKYKDGLAVVGVFLSVS